jgi:hypothetical protein
MQKRSSKQSTKRSKRITKRAKKTRRRTRHIRRRIRGGDYTQQTDADIDGFDVDSSEVSITTEGVSRPYREFLKFAERRSVSGSEN